MKNGLFSPFFRLSKKAPTAEKWMRPKYVPMSKIARRKKYPLFLLVLFIRKKSA